MYVCVCIYIYIYIYIDIISIKQKAWFTGMFPKQFEFFELILLSKLDKQFPAKQFEATVSQSTVPSPSLTSTANIYTYTTIT